MRKIALGMALGASLLSTAAMAADQRPTYLAFSAPADPAAASVNAKPAAPRVAKRNAALGPVPLFVPLVGAVAILGFVAAVSTGNNGSPG